VAAVRVTSVDHFGGTTRVSDLASLKNLLRERHADDLNEFWLSADAQFPVLSISVRGGVAALHFFPHDGHPGFQSRGDEPPGGLVTLQTTNGEEIDVPSQSIVSFVEVQRAAQEFAESLTLPSSLEWFEL